MAIQIQAPQNQQSVQLQRQGTTRVQPGEAPQVRTDFIDILSQGVKNQEDAARRNIDKTRKYMKDSFYNEGQRLAIKAKAEISTLQGEQAMAKKPEIQNRLAREMDDLISKKYNSVDPELSNIIKTERERLLGQFEAVAIPHAYKEKNKIEIQAADQRVKNVSEAMIELGVASPDIFMQNGYKVIRREAYENSISKFGGDSPEAIAVANSFADKTVSESIVGLVNVMATNGQVDKAKEIYDKFSEGTEDGVLLEADKAKVQRLLLKAQDRENGTIAMNLAEDAVKLYGDNEEKAATYIREQINKSNLGDDRKGQIFQESTQFLSAENARRRREEKRQAELSFEGAMKAVDEAAKNGQAIDPNILNTVDASYRSRVLSYAKSRASGAGLVTDKDTHEFLMSKYKDGTLINTNVWNYRDKLNDRHFNNFLTLKKNLITAENSSEQRVANQTYKQHLDITKRFIRAYEDNLADIGSDVAMFTGKQRMELHDVAEEAFEKLQNVPGITLQEMRRRLNKALQEKAVEFKEDIPFWPFDSDELKIVDELDVDTSPIENQDVENVHPSWSDAINIQYYNRYKKYPNASQLKRAIQNLRNKGRNLSNPVEL